MMGWIVYVVTPIDWGWEHLQSVQDVARQIAGDNAAERAGLNGAEAGYYDEISVDQFLSDWQAARNLAATKGWEGDIRQGPVVFWIPDETGFRYAFAFKQDNNGTTFIVTPVKMPWLNRLT